MCTSLLGLIFRKCVEQLPSEVQKHVDECQETLRSSEEETYVFQTTQTSSQNISEADVVSLYSETR